MACCGSVARFLYLLVFCAVDVLLATVFYLHGGAYGAHFAADVAQYRVRTSTVELWVFAVTRACVLAGGLLGVACRRDALTRARLHAGRLPVFVAALLMWMFTIIKMLMYSEEPAMTAPRCAGRGRCSSLWFWLLFSWTLVANAALYPHWVMLGTVTVRRGATLAVNSSADERQGLLTEKGDDAKTNTTMRQKSSNILRLIAYCRPDIHLLALATLFLVASSTAEVFTPYYTGLVIQSIAIEKNQHKFIMAIIYMAVFSLASAVCAGLRGCVFKIVMARMNIRIRNELFSSIVHQEVGFFDTVKTGDITSRLTSDTSTLSDALSLNCNIFLRSLLKAVGICIFMFKLSWRLSLVTIVGIPIIMGVSKAYGGYYETLAKAVQDSLAKANEVAEETCSSLRTVRSFANELAEVSRYASRLVVTYNLKKKEAYAYAGYVWCNELFALSLIVASLYYGGHLVMNNFITGGHLVSFILYQFELSFALESIGDVYTGLMQAVGASEKVFEFIDRKPLIATGAGTYRPEQMEGKVEFRNVTFAYPSRPDAQVLNDVSFTVQPGEVVALVGPSGGGKSSCVNLLEHFYEPTSGSVLIDGVSIADYEHKYLHTKVSLVGQEPVLYACSVRDNIAYGLESCDFAAVEQAARMANAHQFIMEMKEGYSAETGEKGSQLSGGQKQRIAIARAVVRHPSILLLDEATSALDSESEFMVQQALYNNLKGRTVIVIAHRLSTVEKANRIIVIERGRVVEQGSHAELLRRGPAGLYSRLVKRQLLGFDVGFTDHVTRPPAEATDAAGGTMATAARDSFLSLNDDAGSNASKSQSPPTRYGSMC